VETEDLSTLSQKSATVAENGETTATASLFCNSLTFLRQCGHALSHAPCVCIVQQNREYKDI